jgi:hypothetical protein
MALVASLSRITKARQQVHNPVECACSIFVENGKKYLQLETRSSPMRKHPGKTSQTLQFDEKSGRALKKLLEQIFAN